VLTITNTKKPTAFLRLGWQDRLRREGAEEKPVPLVDESAASATATRVCEAQYAPDGLWERHGTDNSDFYTITYRPNFLEMLFLLGPYEGRPPRPGTILDRFDIKMDDAMEEPAVQNELGEIVSQFGFVVFFFVAFPYAPLLAWLNNYLEVRIDAIKVLTLMQRPAPRLMNGIGQHLPQQYCTVNGAMPVSSQPDRVLSQLQVSENDGWRAGILLAAATSCFVGTRLHWVIYLVPPP
jgi:Calcium-activated chloride channel